MMTGVRDPHVCLMQEPRGALADRRESWGQRGPLPVSVSPRGACLGTGPVHSSPTPGPGRARSCPDSWQTCGEERVIRVRNWRKPRDPQVCQLAEGYSGSGICQLCPLRAPMLFQHCYRNWAEPKERSQRTQRQFGEPPRESLSLWSFSG